jgi:hypothetical protein
MKKPAYDSCVMKDPDGTVLCTVGLKKARWYVSKNLAVWLEKEEQEGGDYQQIQLLFEPKRKKNTENTTCEQRPGGQATSYNQSLKENRCFVCGDDDAGYMRHYVVPYSYRRRFPVQYKTHLPHDVVITCPACHVRAEQASAARQRDLEDAARRDAALPPGSERPEICDRGKNAIRSAALALRKRRQELPAGRIAECENLVRQWADAELTEDVLERAAGLETRRPNPAFVSGVDLVVQSLLQSDDHDDCDGDRLADFVRDWRRHFVETMHPRHLPVGWSIDAPVQSDPR